MDNQGEWEDVPAGEEGWEDVPNETIESKAMQEAGIPEGGVLNRGVAGARESIRSIGTGEDLADAYMRGFDNPSKFSETMQEGAIRGVNELLDKSPGIRNMPEGLQTFIRFQQGLGPSVAGMAADIATNPKEALSLAMLERFPSLVKQIAPGLSSRIKEFANKDITLKKGSLSKPASGDVQDMIKQANEEAIEVARQLKTSQATDISKVKNNYTQIKNGLDTKVATLDKEVIPAHADEATLSVRKKFPEYARDLSKRFGADYEKAIAGEKIPTQSLHDALGRTIEQSGILTKPESAWSQSEKRIFDYYNKIQNEIPSMSNTTEVVMGPQGPMRSTVKKGSEFVNASKVDKELRAILETKAGKQYGSGDHILTITRENITEIMPNSAKVKAVRSKYAPELQTKNELFKITQPFNRSGNLDTTRGINFFSNYAKGTLNPDETRLVEMIKSSKQLGSDLFNDLNTASFSRKQLNATKMKLSSEVPGKVSSIKTQYSDAEKALVKDNENHLAMLNDMKQMAVNDESKSEFIKNMIKRGVGLAVGGGLAKAGWDTAGALIPNR